MFSDQNVKFNNKLKQQELVHISQLDSVTQQNAAIAEELNGESEELMQQISFFKLG